MINNYNSPEREKERDRGVNVKSCDKNKCKNGGSNKQCEILNKSFHLFSPTYSLNAIFPTFDHGTSLVQIVEDGAVRVRWRVGIIGMCMAHFIMPQIITVYDGYGAHG